MTYMNVSFSALKSDNYNVMLSWFMYRKLKRRSLYLLNVQYMCQCSAHIYVFLLRRIQKEHKTYNFEIIYYAYPNVRNIVSLQN